MDMVKDALKYHRKYQYPCALHFDMERMFVSFKLMHGINPAKDMEEDHT